MRKIALLLLFVGTLTFATTSRAQDPSVPELKLQLAQKDLEIAKLNLQLLQVQAQLVQVLGDKAQAQVAMAQKAVTDATPKPPAEPPKK